MVSISLPKAVGVGPPYQFLSCALCMRDLSGGHYRSSPSTCNPVVPCCTSLWYFSCVALQGFRVRDCPRGTGMQHLSTFPAGSAHGSAHDSIVCWDNSTGARAEVRVKGWGSWSPSTGQGKEFGCALNPDMLTSAVANQQVLEPQGLSKDTQVNFLGDLTSHRLREEMAEILKPQVQEDSAATGTLSRWLCSTRCTPTAWRK